MVNYTILLAEDEELNVELVERYIADQGHVLTHVETGEEALALLQAEPDGYDVVLLDRMMQGQDGLEILKAIKQDDSLRHIPVVMQTARASDADINEGIEAGAYFYLIKPYSRTLFRSILEAAIRHSPRYYSLHKDGAAPVDEHALDITAEVKNAEEAQRLAYHLSRYYPQPMDALMCLHELLINGIEHGNLGIGFALKTVLLNERKLDEEVARRQKLPENKDKKVRVHFSRDDTLIRTSIADDGDGFKWQRYLQLLPEQAQEAHGRGIALANSCGFDSIRYNTKGNEVTCEVRL